MKPELAEKILALIEARVHSLPTSMEFEMAYQARIAIDRIRFAIKHMELFGPHTDQMREVGFQLLDALHRLEAVDRRFQTRSRAVGAGNGPPNGAAVGAEQDKVRLLDEATGRDRAQRRNADRVD